MAKWTRVLHRQRRPAYKRHLRRHMPSRRQLQVLVLLVLLCVAVPLYMLFHRVYAQLRQEAWYQYRLSAEHVMRLVEDEMLSLISREENRPFADYGFFRVEEQKLLQIKGLALSPLSRFPVSMELPGLIGYFQIHPDGTFTSPVLPDITKAQLQRYEIQFGEAEYTQRLALRKQLEAVLKANRLLTFSPASKRKVSESKQNERMEGRRDRRTSAAPSREAIVSQQSGMTADAADQAQSKTDIALRSTFQGQKLDDLNLNQGLYQKAPATSKVFESRSRTPMGRQSKWSSRKKRTEKIDIPSSQSVDIYREYVNARIEKPKEQSPSIFDDTGSLLVSFEGEIDPIQLYVLQDLTFAFIRKAWKAKQRYIQGLFVNGQTFLQHVIQPRFHNSSIGSVSQLVVSYRGEVLARMASAPSAYGATAIESQGGRPPDGRPDTVIYRTRLATPFDDVTVHVTMPSLPLGPGATVVHGLAVLLPAVLLAGVLGIYRLAAQQIRLAEARHDSVSAVSHELKTPLTSIRMYGEMLRAGWVPDDRKRQTYYDFIFFESERLSRLVANVLHLARLSRQDAPLDLKPITRPPCSIGSARRCTRKLRRRGLPPKLPTRFARTQIDRCVLTSKKMHSRKL